MEMEVKQGSLGAALKFVGKCGFYLGGFVRF
jgi:hypothetical protein